MHETQNSQTNLEKEEQSWRLPKLPTKIPQSRQHGTAIRIDMQSVEQSYESRNKPSSYEQWIFDKGAKTIQWGKNCLFNK